MTKGAVVVDGEGMLAVVAGRAQIALVDSVVAQFSLMRSPGRVDAEHPRVTPAAGWLLGIHVALVVENYRPGAASAVPGGQCRSLWSSVPPTQCV